jgi:hypothetical protein
MTRHLRHLQLGAWVEIRLMNVWMGPCYDPSLPDREQVGDLLRDPGYKVLANRKIREVAFDPDRKRVCQHVNLRALAFQ